MTEEFLLRILPPSLIRVKISNMFKNYLIDTPQLRASNLWRHALVGSGMSLV